LLARFLQNNIKGKKIMSPSPQKSNGKTVLDIRLQELEKARKDYDSIHATVQEKGKRASELGILYKDLSNALHKLTSKRDNLNQELRDLRKEIKEIERSLQVAQYQFNQAEEFTKRTRREVIKQRQEVKEFIPIYEIARSDYEISEKELETSIQKLKTAEKAYVSAGGKLSSKEVFNERKRGFGQSGPWVSGSFYLFVAVVLIVLFSFVRNSISLPVIIGVSLLLIVISIFQLRNDDNLSEEGFTKLLIEVLQKLSLLKPSNQKVLLPEVAASDKQQDDKGDDNQDSESVQPKTG
jgi:hypothetical protein